MHLNFSGKYPLPYPLQLLQHDTAFTAKTRKALEIQAFCNSMIHHVTAPFQFKSGCHLQLKLPKHLCFGSFLCPKAGFSLIFSLIGSTGGNCTDKTLHAVGTFTLHLVSHMAIHVQREGGSGVAQITLHCLDVVPGADRGDCGGVTQVVETGIGTTRRFKSGCHLQKKTTLSGGFLLFPPRTAMCVL